MDPELIKQISPKDYFTAFYQEDIRPDNRSIEQCRKFAISLENNTSTVRIGNTGVMCSFTPGGDSHTIDGWDSLSFLGDAAGRTTVKILYDDGNLIEAVSLAYQLAIHKENVLIPFTFVDVYGYYVRDPTKEEENQANSKITVFLTENLVIIDRQTGNPIPMSDLEGLIQTCLFSVPSALRNLKKLSQTSSFIGELHSN